MPRMNKAKVERLKGRCMVQDGLALHILHPVANSCLEVTKGRDIQVIEELSNRCPVEQMVQVEFAGQNLY